MDLSESLKHHSSRQLIIQNRICDFHQLYQNRDKEKHPYNGPAFYCVECNKYGCKDCIHSTTYTTDQNKSIFICAPCYYRHQVRLSIGLLTKS